MESAEVGGRLRSLSDSSRLTMGLDPEAIRASICALYIGPSDINPVKDGIRSIQWLRDTKPAQV